MSKLHWPEQVEVGNMTRPSPYRSEASGSADLAFASRPGLGSEHVPFGRKHRGSRQSKMDLPLRLRVFPETPGQIEDRGSEICRVCLEGGGGAKCPTRESVQGYPAADGLLDFRGDDFWSIHCWTAYSCEAKLDGLPGLHTAARQLAYRSCRQARSAPSGDVEAFRG